VHLVGETPDLGIQVAKAIKGQSACLKPVLATVSLDVPGNTTIGGINVHKTGNYNAINDPDLVPYVDWTPTLFTGIDPTQQVIPLVESRAGPFNW